MVDSPCLGCLDRKVGCHGTCDKYISWHENHVENKQFIAKKRAEISAADSFKIQQTLKSVRRRNGK